MSTTVKYMDQNEVVSILRKEAKENEAASAVFTAWAMRKRARQQVTVHSLSQRMRAEGFNFSSEQYGSLLRKLSKAGIGRLETTKSGKVKALKDIKITLQSLGSAAVGMNHRLERFTKQNQYSALTQMARELKGSPQNKVAPMEFPVSLTLVVNGKPVNFRIPANLTPEEIALIVKRFQEGK